MSAFNNWNREFMDAARDMVVELEGAIDKHGFAKTPMNPRMGKEKRFIILAEEVGEVARALTYDEGDEGKLEEELIQVASMAIASVIGMRLKRNVSNV